MTKMFLKPVEVPTHCFLSELVEWAAFGRVPEHTASPDGVSQRASVDIRFDPENMPENFDVPPFSTVSYSEAECQMYDIEYDQSYLERLESTFASNYLPFEPGGRASEEYLRTIGERYGEAFAKASLAEFERRKEVRSADLHAIRQFERKLEQPLEVAWSRVFNEVQSGRITVEGMLTASWETMLEEGDATDGHTISETIPFEPISPKLISLRTNWQENRIESPKRYFNLRVTTDHMDILTPENSLGEVTVTRYGDYFIASGLSSAHPPSLPHRMGRPPKANYVEARLALLRDAVRGQPFPNKESAYQHFRYLVHKMHDAEISISTAKSQAKTEVESIFENTVRKSGGK